mmetsp:Transcript_17319/g.26235  ORF Transcript_17319/g.26235 Transcript_17319/m.26235 type:complete len:272 (-) Transcript_17319:48-863(-)
MYHSKNNNGKQYVIPTCNDVLCGRGSVQFQHPGNQKLRRKIAETLDSYISCESRQGRTAIIRDTITYIQVNQGGRFLKADKNGSWYDGGIQAAKSRVSTAFRDARVPNKVKCMEHLKKENSNIKELISSLPCEFKNSQFNPMSDSLSSFTKALVECFDNEEKKTELTTSSAPSRSKEFLDSSISSIDPEILTNLITPEKSSKCGMENILQSAMSHSSMDCSDWMDSLDFGGRKFFDIAESEELNTCHNNHLSNSFNEDAWRGMMPCIAPSA